MVSTSHITINHPIIAAKQSAAIDHISDGRFILNIVTGWVQPEIEMFGQPMLGHEDRYACAEEWLAIVKRLWTEDESFDHEGRFFKIKKGYLAPKPIQYPYPAIMNAGASELGRHYAVKNCDLVFTVIRTGGLEECTAHVQAYHKLARDYGRDIKVWTLVNIVQGETEKEARDFYNYYVHQQGDWEAAKNMVEIFSLETNKRNVPPERMKPLQEAFIQGWGGLPVVGTREQVVDTLATLVEGRARRPAGGVPALRGGHEGFPRQDLSAAQAGGIAGFPVNSIKNLGERHDQRNAGAIRIPALDRHADRLQSAGDRGAGAARLRLHGAASALPVPRPAADGGLRQDRHHAGAGPRAARRGRLHEQAARLSRLRRRRSRSPASR